MKYGLHFLMSDSKVKSHTQQYEDTIAQAIRGEALGFESVWPVEHHFSNNASILSCPTLLLAAIAARTQRMRLGTAIIQLPLAHPLRVAEEMATLDVLSGGRVEFGVGRGSNLLHFAGFGVPLSENRDRFVEGLELIQQAWTQEQFSFEGRFFRGEEVSLAPRPVQSRLPVRIAANSPETAAFAGRAGYPVFAATNINPLPKLREIVAIYRAERKAAGYAESPDDFTLLIPLFVGKDREYIRRDTEASVLHSVQLVHQMTAAMARRASSEEERQKSLALLDRMANMSYEMISDIMGIFETPEGCVERLQQIQAEFNPGRVICWFNFGGQIPHDTILRSMELFAARVIPFVA